MSRLPSSNYSQINKGVLVNEHHIQDDLESEWVTEEYTKPAKEYIMHQLGTLVLAESIQQSIV